ncbi:hypothetical protein XBI1_810001 [Xenorhabdus bovienii str. Intermedium]|uniref:Uncharacterized protein n=1 Tax=Xenorhabdus bovienii str. Intermedium TaxID=1379677 RepID=A0A077QP26_XENBV|nr:hypothetical protein XBI1_810001 [Xenorhabdus bovienii str. Intermedium]
MLFMMMAFSERKTHCQFIATEWGEIIPSYYILIKILLISHFYN